jgi:hypothetical protein
MRDVFLIKTFQSCLNVAFTNSSSWYKLFGLIKIIGSRILKMLSRSTEVFKNGSWTKNGASQKKPVPILSGRM